MADMTGRWKKLAPVGVAAHICFLAFSSQLLFSRIEPHPLSWKQTIYFNLLVLFLVLCFIRACITPPGALSTALEDVDPVAAEDEDKAIRRRWCRKCQRTKPPRWHHCRTCGTCIPKMDHHCVWMNNCVSHTTFPHFIRFLVYSVMAMLFLEYLLAIRLKVLWDNRKLPSYYGPSALQLSHLLILSLANSLTMFGLAVLLLSSLWGLILNKTTIEGWEIERHDALVRRARVLGGYVWGPGGVKVWIKRQEFPYDIGFWSNLSQGMGSRNMLAWTWPFSASPSAETAMQFEVNDFEDKQTVWPPPDPDRIPIYRDSPEPQASSEFRPDPSHHTFTSSEVDEFRKRQADDLQRRSQDNRTVHKRQPFHQTNGDVPTTVPDDAVGEEAWRSPEGEKLEDFGLDPEVEFYDEDLPLSQLIQKRKIR